MLRRKGREHRSKPKDRLPVAQRAAHGVGHVLNDLVSSVWFSYLIIYLTKVVQLSNRHTGLVILLGQIADGIFTPFIGIVCDRTVCRYGRRKLWHLIGTALVTVTFPLLLIHLLNADTTNALKMVYYVGVAAVFQFGWGCVQISHLSLIPELSRRTSERLELNAIRSAVTFLCGIYAYGVTWVLLGQSTEYNITPKVWKEFMYLSFIIIVTGNIFNIIFHVIIKEPLAKTQQKTLKAGTLGRASVLPEPATLSTKQDNGFINHALDTNTSNDNQELEVQDVTYHHCNGVTTQDCMTNTTSVTKDGIVTKFDCVTEKYPKSCNGGCMVTNENPPTSQSDCMTIINRNPQRSFPTCKIEWLKSPCLYKTASVYMCTRLVVNISQCYLPLYLTETLNFEKEAIAYFPLVALISGVIASLLVKSLSKRLGQKITYIIGATIALGACVWFYLQPVDMRNAVYAATALIGSGGSVMLVTSLTMISDLVGDDKKCGAFIYGAISFSDKVSSGIVIAIIQELNPRDHQVEACSECNEYVRIVLSIAPGIAALVGLLTVALCYNSKFVCRIRAEYRETGVQVNVDRKCDDEDISELAECSSNQDNSICYNDTPENVAQIHCNCEKPITPMDIDTRF